MFDVGEDAAEETRKLAVVGFIDARYASPPLAGMVVNGDTDLPEIVRDCLAP
jgi:hypothetical protein